jgi:hypothetical protein
MERRAPWTIAGLGVPVPCSIVPDSVRLEWEREGWRVPREPMLDPAWTPSAGYSHAQALMDAVSATTKGR